MKKPILYFLLSGAFLVCGAAEPVIYCSFDHGVNADFGGVRGGDVAGSSTGGVAGVLNSRRGSVTDAEQRPGGISGRAFLAGRSADGKNAYSVRYAPLGGLSPDAGTVMFWVAPQNWSGGDKRFHLFFSASGEKQQMIIYKYHTGEKILFYYKSGDRITALEYKISDWREKEFHHIAAAWNGSEISLYVDGVFRQGKLLAQKASNPFTAFTVGSLNEWSNDSGKTLIDELKLYDSYLGADEIAKEFARFSGRAFRATSPLFIGVSVRTPVPDGSVNEFEYAFAGSGFWDLATRKYASRQSRFFLSKDKQNLYIAAVGGGKDLKADKTRRDDALWEDDSIEIHLASPDGDKSGYQFIFNSKDVFYDAKDGRREWNAEGVRSVSRVENGIWTIEIVLPIVNFTHGDLKNVRLNLCRAYRDLSENTTLGPCVASFSDRANFAEVSFHKKYPVISLGEFGDLGDRHPALEGKILGVGKDRISVRMDAAAPLLPFQFRRSMPLDAGKTIAFSAVSDSLPENRQLNIGIASSACGEIYRNTLEYRNRKPLAFACLYTDLPEKVFNLVCRNSRIGGDANTVTIRFIEQATGKTALEKTQTLPSSSILVKARVELAGLKPGDYRMEYCFSGRDGKEFFRSYELYRVYPEHPEWENCQAGISDEVPSPWTPVEATAGEFRCWGKTYRFGSGLPDSIRTQGRELLAAPLELKLGKENVIFSTRLIEHGASFAIYELAAEKSGIRFNLTLKAEFDGLLWGRLTLGPESAPVRIGHLAFSIPLKREYANYFDNCRSAGGKIILNGMPEKELTNDLSVMPFFWIGSDSVGLMGGMPSLKGWHVRNKNRSMVLDVRKESVSIHWNLIADPLELKSARTIEFYLQATPVKPKNIAALALRDGRNTVMWTGYWSRFYEMQDPAFLNYEKIRQLRRTDKKLFYYATAKGVSCYSPDWNYFGKYWISSPPRLGEYQIDSDVSSREKRDRNTYTYGCLNCRSFLDYKVGSLARMIALDALDMHNVYFDIAWPRSCDNTEHGCGWVDEFGQHQTTFDIAGTREFYLRAYKLLRRKYPDAMFAGHLTSTRTPADSFFDILVRGEVYDRKVAERGSYFDVFHPVGLRISEASRSNEQSIWILSQFTRSLLLFRPAEYSRFKQNDPETDRAIRHYLGYLLLHNLVNWGTDVSEREKAVFAAQDRLGWNENIVFHPYWEKQNPVKILNPESDRMLVSAYANGGKALAVLMNDTDLTRKMNLKFDTDMLGLSQEQEAVEMFSSGIYRLSGGALSLDMKPREAKFLLFDVK